MSVRSYVCYSVRYVGGVYCVFSLADLRFDKFCYKPIILKKND